MTEPVTAVEEAGPGRGTTGWMGKLGFTISVVMSLYAILWLSGAFRLFGIQITSMENRGAILAFTMFLTFILYPATKKAPRDRLPWYDIILMVMGVAGGAYFFFFYEGCRTGPGEGARHTLPAGTDAGYGDSSLRRGKASCWPLAINNSWILFRPHLRFQLFPVDI